MDPPRGARLNRLLTQKLRFHLMPKSNTLAIPDPAALIITMRGQRVILDGDLASLYGVETGQFNRAVQRHLDRFPSDFMFQLTKDEYEGLRCQIGISKGGRGGRRYLPYVFTQEGVAMLSSVLQSSRAAAVNVAVGLFRISGVKRQVGALWPDLARARKPLFLDFGFTQRLLTNSAARLMAAIMLSGRALPVPAISKAVP